MADKVEEVGRLLCNTKHPLKLRFRALFTLKNLGGDKAIEYISKCFEDNSALLKHELAYCLGQMKDATAVSKLVSVLSDENQQVVVRHEAAEALGSIGGEDAVRKLMEYREYCVPEIAETCQVALARLRYLQDGGVYRTNIYDSVDPAPPLDENSVQTLKHIYLDERKSIFERYRAMFRLRDIGTDECVHILTEGLCRGSVLFRHEVAFVLGQLQSPLSVPALIEKVENSQENDIVRHECIEALGSIGDAKCMEIISKYVHDKEHLVRESCEIALDIRDYNNSYQFQYANGLEMVQQ